MKQRLLEQILQLTQRQKIALENDDIEKFRRLLEKRQQKMDAIDVMIEQNLEVQNEKQNSIITEILVRDRDNRELFNKRYDMTKMKLGEIRTQQKVNHAYKNPYTRSQEEGIFFDKK